MPTKPDIRESARQRIPSFVPMNVRRMVNDIQEPKGYLSGIRISEALVPDNIVFFHRDRPVGWSSGVSQNYHHRFELLTVIENGGPIRIGETNYRLEDGEAMLVFPNQFHLYAGMSQEKFSWMFFTFNLHRPEVVQDLRDTPRKLDAAAIQCLERLLSSFVYPDNGVHNGLHISMELADMLRALLACPPIPAARCGVRLEEDKRGQLLEQINLYVRDNLDKPITIEALAASLGYSVSYARAVFREALGVSLGRYIRESRLAEAAQLLQEPSIKVTDAAARCGFESLVVFSRAFKKAFGIAPKDYSKRAQQPAFLHAD